VRRSFPKWEVRDSSWEHLAIVFNECPVPSNERAFKRNDVAQGVIIPSLQRR
jgi:hypothetical protein